MEAQGAMTMFQRFISWLKGVWGRVFGFDSVASSLGGDVMVSSKMQAAIDQWWKMFENRPPWVSEEDIPTISLPSAVAGEIARLVTVEAESSLTGSPRADYLNKPWQEMMGDLRRQVEFASAGGHLVFKPYVDEGGLTIDYVKAGRFIPTAYTSRGEINGGVFVERVRRGKIWYTRLEKHEMAGDGYHIVNEAYASSQEEQLGREIPLTQVPEWSKLAPVLTIKYSTADGGEALLEHPLFAVFNMPMANTIDPDSPLGPSIYSRATGPIEQADRQYGRTLWEYEGGELAVDASAGALRADKGGKTDATGRPVLEMPHGRERLFRELNLDGGNGADLYQVFSPALRDASLFNGLNKLLQRIEFNCYLSYGTLSDPQSVEKTAEEIKMSKQRSYSAVCDIQKALETALRRVAWIMDIYASVYGLAPAGAVNPAFAWGDAVTVDTDKEREQMRQDCRDGAAQWWEYRMRFYGETEEVAKQKVAAGQEDKSDDDWMNFNK